MTRDLPKLEVVDVRGNDLLVATDAVLVSNHLDKLVVDGGTFGVEEGTAGRHFEMVEEVLSLANLTMVALLGLLSEVDVLVKLLLGGISDTVDSLEIIVGDLSEPVSC